MTLKKIILEFFINHPMCNISCTILKILGNTSNLLNEAISSHQNVKKKPCKYFLIRINNNNIIEVKL